GHTEAAVELARLAECEPVGAIAEIVDDAGQPLRAPALRRFADEHGLVMISIADLIAHLDATDAAEDAVPRAAANDAGAAAQDAKGTTRPSAVDVAGGATAPSVDTTGEGDRIA
ncbi:3,4-dihydroxy-2-butanone-4-phosphate synthase, partial [Streptomyces sp. tea 10]|nr:3,4-dihydroxy-2-butanone-4-phosphate synthase [Streptomyces sp. tea 10]